MTSPPFQSSSSTLLTRGATGSILHWPPSPAGKKNARRRACPLPPRAPRPHPPPARESALTVSVRTNVSQHQAWPWGGGRETTLPSSPSSAPSPSCPSLIGDQITAIGLSGLEEKRWPLPRPDTVRNAGTPELSAPTSPGRTGFPLLPSPPPSLSSCRHFLAPRRDLLLLWSCIPSPGPSVHMHPHSFSPNRYLPLSPLLLGPAPELPAPPPGLRPFPRRRPLIFLISQCLPLPHSTHTFYLSSRPA